MSVPETSQSVLRVRSNDSLSALVLNRGIDVSGNWLIGGGINTRKEIVLRPIGLVSAGRLSESRTE